MPPPLSYLRASLHGQPPASAFEFPGHDSTLLLEQPRRTLQQPDRSFPLIPGALAAGKPGTADHLLQSAPQYIVSTVHGSYLFLLLDDTAPSILPGKCAELRRDLMPQRG